MQWSFSTGTLWWVSTGHLTNLVTSTGGSMVHGGFRQTDYSLDQYEMDVAGSSINGDRITAVILPSSL